MTFRHRHPVYDFLSSGFSRAKGKQADSLVRERPSGTRRSLSCLQKIRKTSPALVTPGMDGP